MAPAALVFVACAAATFIWCSSMSALGGMPMPGGWTMSMAWMRMPGQTWSGAALSFLGMWIVMMVAMMLPSLIPMLRRYRQAVADSPTPRRDRLTAVVALGYFAVWAGIGLAIFPPGVALAGLEMQQPALARAVPLAAGAVIVAAGCFQFTRWKARCLACCREAPAHGHMLSDSARTAWRHGVGLGLHCACCCANLMAILLAAGMMDPGVMAAVAIAITAERFAPDGDRIARAIGSVIVVAGVVLISVVLFSGGTR